jgi:hypothetical protein
LAHLKAYGYRGICDKIERHETRDVIFDETTFVDGKRTDLSDGLIAELDTLIEKVKLPETQAMNEAMLEEDEEVLEPAEEVESYDEGELSKDFDQNEDLELAKALEEAYLTPPYTDDQDEGSPCAFHAEYPLERTTAASEQTPEDLSGERDKKDLPPLPRSLKDR